MESIEPINEFLSTHPIALVGVSRDKQKFGYKAFRRLKLKGFTVYPVNPNTDLIDEDKCYKSIDSLPSEVESVILMTPKSVTEEAVAEAISKGIKNIWIQHHSETKPAIDMAKKAKIHLVTEECILMYAKPSGAHKFHAFMKKMFHTYPK